MGDSDVMLESIKTSEHEERPRLLQKVQTSQLRSTSIWIRTGHCHQPMENVEDVAE